MATYDPRQTFKAQELSFSRAAGTQTSKQQGLSVGAGTPDNNRGSTYDEVPQVITSSPLPGLGSRSKKEDKKEKTFTEKVYDFFVGAGADVTEPEKDFYAMPVYESPMFKIPTVPEVTEQGIKDPFDQFNVNPFKFGGYDDTRDAAPQATQMQDPDMNDPRRGLMAPPTMDQPSTPEALTGIPRGLALGNSTPTKSYRIKDGDTLSEIAEDNNTTVKAIMDLNAEIEEADVIDAGDTIQLPLSGTQAALRAGFDRDKEDEGVEVAGAYGLINAIPSLKPDVSADTYTSPDTMSDLEILARTIEKEAGGESKKGKLAVGATIANRVKAQSWMGKNLKEVILMPGQFSPWNSYTNYEDGEQGKEMLGVSAKPSEESYEAAKKILSGDYEDPTSGATHFVNPKISKPWWYKKFTDNDPLKIGNHQFGSPDNPNWKFIESLRPKLRPLGRS